jgi:hypothetical protein
MTVSAAGRINATARARLKNLCESDISYCPFRVSLFDEEKIRAAGLGRCDGRHEARLAAFDWVSDADGPGKSKSATSQSGNLSEHSRFHFSLWSI